MIIGLGNRGPQYTSTRHNVGFQAVDLIAAKLNLRFRKPLFKNFQIGKGSYNGRRFAIVKPMTFMNHSGEILGAVLRYTRTSVKEIVVICDTLDLPPGNCRIKRRGSSAGHKGLASIANVAETEDFIRIYIGIGRPAEKDDIVRYVLSRPTDEEQRNLDQALEKAAQAALDLLQEPIETIMSRLNKANGRH